MRARTVLASGLVATLGAAASALAATGASGNAQAISIARAESRAYSRIHTVQYTETGFIEMTSLEGKSSYFHFSWGQTTLTPGWVWATEHGIVVLSHGRVVWWRDDLTPPSCTSGFCHQVPVELLSEHSGAYYAFGSATSHTCFGRLSGSQPVTVGAKWNRVVGHFAAPVYGAGIVKLTYTYPWGKGRTARETDTLSASTHLEKSGRVVISGGHTFHFTFAKPAGARSAPKVNLCSG